MDRVHLYMEIQAPDGTAFGRQLADFLNQLITSGGQVVTLALSVVPTDTELLRVAQVVFQIERARNEVFRTIFADQWGIVDSYE